jgi:hypothetical protein
VSARWPLLQLEQWQSLLDALNRNRQQIPAGGEFWQRLGAALRTAGQGLADASNPMHRLALSALPGYTGYSEAMIRFTLGALDMMSLESMPETFRLPGEDIARDWQPMPGLPGRLRFFPAGGRLRKASLFGGRPLYGAVQPLDVVLGYGAGNVPGTALLITFLALASTLAGGQVPVVVVKNSRREPIFAPLVLNALEAVDPQLVSTVAVLVWDYGDSAVQDFLLGQAGLVIAAAGDDTIADIRRQVEAQRGKLKRTTTSTRFHAHGHKVSFSAIGREVLAPGLFDPHSGHAVLDIVALLAALDSAFWDQHGCLSSRVHFVEIGGSHGMTAFDYAGRLEVQMRLLADLLPRGAWPRQALNDRFDRYKALEKTGKVIVCSRYGDEFLVVVDRRPLSSAVFANLVNDCQGRVIFVRPVSDLMEVPEIYLRYLPPANLQSLSVAVGQPGEGLSESFLRFASACGRRGVTAIRTVGRGAFPQLAYSWDGFVPLDLRRERQAGYFTSIEFDHPYEEMINTFQRMRLSNPL